MFHTPTDKLVASRGLILPGLPRAGMTPIHDADQVYDQQFIDSAGAFLVGELERLDPTMHMPLVDVTWWRDIDLRTDVSMGDETTSYTTSTFGSVGGAAPAGISWAGKETTTLPRAQVDIQKIKNDLTPWAHEVAYSVYDLASAMAAGRPIDSQMLMELRLKHNMDTDQMVYVGDSGIGATGLLNSALMTNVANVANGVAGTPQWTTKTPDEILNDFNEMLVSAWAASGYAVAPNKVLIAPVPFGYLTSRLIGIAGSSSILTYVSENNIMTAQRKIQLSILPCKWLDKANINGPGGSAATYDRMIAYTQRPDFVRFPMVPLQTMAPQFRSLWIAVPYFGKLGRVELVYPETIAARDGIR